MTTAEDVFYLYERNFNHYTDCKKQQKLTTCTDSWANECFCYTKNDVQPITIGNQVVPCSLKRKCYIKPGEECPICLDGILKKSESYLTVCGHSFHKRCIFTSMETEWNQKYAGVYRCPVCRTNLACDIHDINSRYKFNKNNLDNLENFWLSKDFILVQRCSNNYDHDIGMIPDCYVCSKYRENGDLLYLV
jgi:Ring finger domain